MATLDTSLLALIIFLAVCVCALFFVGIYNIRRGLQRARRERALRGPDAATIHWYNQPKVLFGLNNIAFALLLLGILFLSLFTAPGVHYVLFGLIGLLFIISIVLMIRMLIASFAMVRNLQINSSRAKSKGDEQLPS
jgi:hypothetical protein